MAQQSCTGKNDNNHKEEKKSTTNDFLEDNSEVSSNKKCDVAAIAMAKCNKDTAGN